MIPLMVIKSLILNCVWQSRDDRVTFRRLSRDCSETFFEMFEILAKMLKKFVQAMIGFDLKSTTVVRKCLHIFLD